MKKEEVRELARKFAAAMEEEKNIRAQLMDLKFYGKERDVTDALVQQEKLIDRIVQLRKTEMLPVLETLADFIVEKAGNPPTPQERMLNAIDVGKRRVAEGRLHAGMPGKAEPTKPKKKKGKPVRTTPAAK